MLRHRFLDSNTGNVAIIAAVSIQVMAIVIFGALQMSNAINERRILQKSLDAAVISAAREFSIRTNRMRAIDAIDAANISFQENLDGLSSSFDPTLEPVYNVTITDSDIMIEASITSKIDFPLNGVLGLPVYETTVSSASFISIPRDEITMVMDVSASMEGDRIAALRVAATDFVRTVEPFERISGTYRYINLVPFANRVNLGPRGADYLAPPTPEFPASTYVGCYRPEAPSEQAQDGTDGIGSFLPFLQSIHLPSGYPRCPSESSQVLLGSGDEDALVNHINNMELGFGTGTDHALSWGWRTLSPNWRNRFEMPSGLPASFNRRHRKVLILLTDGRIVNQDYVPDGSGGEVISRRDEAESLEAFREVCEAIATQGHIEVFTIGFELRASAVDLEDALRDCATDDGGFFNASLENLGDVFDDIAGVVNTALLTE